MLHTFHSSPDQILFYLPVVVFGRLEILPWIFLPMYIQVHRLYKTDSCVFHNCNLFVLAVIWAIYVNNITVYVVYLMVILIWQVRIASPNYIYVILKLFSTSIHATFGMALFTFFKKAKTDIHCYLKRVATVDFHSVWILRIMYPVHKIFLSLILYVHAIGYAICKIQMQKKSAVYVTIWSFAVRICPLAFIANCSILSISWIAM